MKIPGILTDVTTRGVVVETSQIKDIPQNKTQEQINADLQDDVIDIKGKIPAAATTSNQLADKQFVNDSVATNTATFRGTYRLYDELGVPVVQREPETTVEYNKQNAAEALAQMISVKDNNDYCFILVPVNNAYGADTAYTDRYKYNGVEWDYEYTLNSSGFTTEQWSAINSGITQTLVTQIIDAPFEPGAGSNSAQLKGGNVAIGDNSVAEGRGYTHTPEDVIVCRSATSNFFEYINYTTEPTVGELYIDVDNTLIVKVESVQTDIGFNFSISSGHLNTGVEYTLLPLKAGAIGDYSHAEGDQTKASGNSSHGEGRRVVASGENSHAEGSNTYATGLNAHTEGGGANYDDPRNLPNDTKDTNNNGLEARGEHSHAEGWGTKAFGNKSHAEGERSIASGMLSHAEGLETIASKSYSHAEGFKTQASGERSHAEGGMTTASGNKAHAEGGSTVASGESSHAEGQNTTATGTYSHAGGNNSIARGVNSFAHGDHVNAYNEGEVTFGKYNHSSSNTLFSIGMGTSENNRDNAFEVTSNGSVTVKQSLTVGGIDVNQKLNALETSLTNTNSWIDDVATDVNAHETQLTAIEGKIPSAATSSNQLADKNFVNSSIATATATFRGSYRLFDDLGVTVTGDTYDKTTCISHLASTISSADNNDYCFVVVPTENTTGAATQYIDRYKYNGTAWSYEYTLNNSGFTAEQWAAINSGVTPAFINSAATKDYVENKLSESVADWNENDSSATDYVKNRTHYSEGNRYQFEYNITTADDRYVYAYINGNSLFQYLNSNNINSINVVFKGTTYNLPIGFITEQGNNKGIYIGDKIKTVSGDTQDGSSRIYPLSFYLDINSAGVNNSGIAIKDGEGAASTDYFVGVGEYNELIHKLDSKYFDAVKSADLAGYGTDVAPNGELHFGDEFDLGTSNGQANSVILKTPFTSSEKTKLSDLPTNATLETRLQTIEGSSVFEAGTGTNSAKTKNSGAYVIASGIGSFANGRGGSDASMEVSGSYSHAEGYGTKASVSYSHAEGAYSAAKKNGSHAEGYNTIADGEYSHTEGGYTKTTNQYEHASGKYNKSTKDVTLASIGCGTDDNNRKNAFEVDTSGNVYIKGINGYDGTNSHNMANVSIQNFLSNIILDGYTIDDTISTPYHGTVTIKKDNQPVSGADLYNTLKGYWDKGKVPVLKILLSSATASYNLPMYYQPVGEMASHLVLSNDVVIGLRISSTGVANLVLNSVTNLFT